MKQKSILIMLACLTFSLSACGKDSVGNKSIGNYGMFNNATVSGSQISGTLGAVELYGKDVAIYVHTGVNKPGFYAQTTSCYTVSQESIAVKSEGCEMIPLSRMNEDITENQSYHINPFGQFHSELFKDKKGDIRFIEFTQQ
jgi:hypothetical protein